MNTYKTCGTCSRSIDFDVQDGVVTACHFNGGCTGNLQGIGVGTVVGALTYGRMAGFYGDLLDKKFDFVSVLSSREEAL